MSRRGPARRVDPLLAGLVGAAVVAGGGLVAYGSSQAADDPPSTPAAVEQRDDDLAARALEAVAAYAGSGEDGVPSDTAAVRRAAQASLRGLKVDPFRAVPKGDTATRSGAAAGDGAAAGSGAASGSTGGTASGSGAAGTADVTASAVRQARKAVAAAAAAADAAGGDAGGAGSSSKGADAKGTGSSAGGADGSRSGGDASGSGGDDASGSGSAGDSPSSGGERNGGASGDDGGDTGSDGSSAVRGETVPDPLTLAARPARLTLRVRTPSSIRRRERVRVGTLLPNRNDPVLRILRVARDNRTVTLRLRTGARLSGKQSPGTRCVVRELPSGQCRLVHVVAGRAAVVEGAGVDGQPGRVTAVRVLAVWRGPVDVTER